MATPTVSPIPNGMHSLTPHLICANAAAAIDYYRTAFGAVELSRLPGPDGKLMHAMLRIGDSVLMLVDEAPQLGLHGTKSPVLIHLYVDDVDATVAGAVEAGARITMPVADMFWGDRYGRIEDPFGHGWSIATHQRDVSESEMQAAMAKMAAG